MVTPMPGIVVSAPLLEPPLNTYPQYGVRNMIIDLILNYLYFS